MGDIDFVVIFCLLFPVVLFLGVLHEAMTDKAIWIFRVPIHKVITEPLVWLLRLWYRITGYPVEFVLTWSIFLLFLIPSIIFLGRMSLFVEVRGKVEAKNEVYLDHVNGAIRPMIRSTEGWCMTKRGYVKEGQVIELAVPFEDRKEKVAYAGFNKRRITRTVREATAFEVREYGISNPEVVE